MNNEFNFMRAPKQKREMGNTWKLLHHSSPKIINKIPGIQLGEPASNYICIAR